MRGGLHGFREQRARCAGAGLPGAGSVARRWRQPRHPFRIGVLDAAAGPPWVRFPAGGVVGSGTRHRHRRLRRLRAGRSRNPDHRAADGDTPRRPAAAAGAAARRGAGCAGGDPDRRRLAAGRRMVEAHSGALAGEHAAWQAFCAATGAVHVSDLAEFADTLELFSAGRRAQPRWHCDGARFGRRTRAGRRPRPRAGRRVRRSRRGHTRHDRRHARRRAGGHQPAGRVGYRCRHPQPVRRLPACDGRRPWRRRHSACRRSGHRVRR